jgi:hypothetical protein
MRWTRLVPLLLLAGSTVGAAAAPARAVKPVLPWIADDYARALSEARAKKLPLFVEAWAPW